ncbi:MAG: ribonuclease [Lachnospiraceae bacterium]|nr:ribonuclease [Lachnospiraceae bacterium]
MKIFQKTLKTIGIPVALLLILWGCARQPGTAPAAPGATAAPAASSQETAAAPDDSSSAGESASAQDVPAQEASYTSAEDVALYLHTYGTLPPNFVTKQEAREAGWDAEKGNLQDVLPGMSIGGDRFGNREGLLPDAPGRTYYECDIDYHGGRRGAKRLVYSDDGLIFYTADHYASFEQLY